MLALAVDPKICKNGPLCMYNHKHLRTPKSPEFTLLGGLIGEGGGSRLDSGSPNRTRLKTPAAL